jgi:hypothetical protein
MEMAENMLIDNMNNQFLNMNNQTHRSSLNSFGIRVPKKADIP